MHALHGQSFSTRHRRSTSEPSTQYEPCVGWSCNGARLLLAPPRSPASCEPDLHRTAHLDSCTQTRPRGGPCLQHCWGQRGSTPRWVFCGRQPLQRRAKVACTATPTARTQRPIRPPANYSHVPLSPSGTSRLDRTAPDGARSTAEHPGLTSDLGDTAADAPTAPPPAKASDARYATWPASRPVSPREPEPTLTHTYPHLRPRRFSPASRPPHPRLIRTRSPHGRSRAARPAVAAAAPIGSRRWGPCPVPARAVAAARGGRTAVPAAADSSGACTDVRGMRGARSAVPADHGAAIGWGLRKSLAFWL